MSRSQFLRMPHQSLSMDHIQLDRGHACNSGAPRWAKQWLILHSKWHSWALSGPKRLKGGGGVRGGKATHSLSQTDPSHLWITLALRGDPPVTSRWTEPAQLEPSSDPVPCRTCLLPLLLLLAANKAAPSPSQTGGSQMIAANQRGDVHAAQQFMKDWGPAPWAV